MKDIKAITCDVDGTLLTNAGVVDEKTVASIKKARQKGYLFGIATGREPLSVKDQLKTWGLEGQVDFIVGSGGSELCDLKLDKDEYNYPLDGELIKEIMHHYQKLPVNFAIPYQGLLYAPKEDKLIKMLAREDKIPYKVVDFDEFLKEPKPKVMIVCDPKDMPKIVEHGKSFSNPKYKSAALITASILYEYVDPRVSKTFGLQKVLSWHNLTLENLCAFGDADNDHDMIQNAKIGVVMANGSDLTKSVADFITDDNEHAGIANYLENEFLADNN